MELTLQALGVLGVLVGAVALWFVGIELGRLRQLLEFGAIRVIVSEIVRDCCASGNPPGKPPGGYALYMFRQGKWEVTADLSSPGFTARPPSLVGSFDGQLIKVPSMR